MLQISTTNPIPDPEGGKDFDKFAVTMAISPLIAETSLEAAIAVRLTPLRINEDGTIDTLPDQDISVLFGQAFAAAQSDPALAEAMLTILQALQQFIIAKGL